MAKLIIADDLKRRIKFAAQNGSVVAEHLMTIITEGRNKNITELVGDKVCNYFDSKVITHTSSYNQGIDIQISYCSKDVNNEHNPDYGNPDAPYFKNNRTYTSPVTFAKFFLEIDQADYSPIDLAYFDSAIRLASKVTIVMSDKMSDFQKAYFVDNYAYRIEHGCNTLHNSCMRYETTSANASDFYAHVAGASIIYAKDDAGCVLARAVVWKDVDFGDCGMLSFVERTYFSYNFLLPMIRKYAEEHGIHFYKTYNEIGREKYFTCLRDFDDFHKGEEHTLSCEKRVPAIKWHKKGAPYCDTMVWMYYENGECVLKNTDRSANKIAEMHSTSGAASRYYTICPCCGKTHSDGDGLCNDCRNSHIEHTAIGDIMQGTTKTYKGMKLPSFLFSNGAASPNKHCLNWISVQKLFRN